LQPSLPDYQSENPSKKSEKTQKGETAVRKINEKRPKRMQLLNLKFAHCGTDFIRFIGD